MAHRVCWVIVRHGVSFAGLPSVAQRHNVRRVLARSFGVLKAQSERARAQRDEA